MILVSVGLVSGLVLGLVSVYVLVMVRLRWVLVGDCCVVVRFSMRVVYFRFSCVGWFGVFTRAGSLDGVLVSLCLLVCGCWCCLSSMIWFSFCFLWGLQNSFVLGM